MSVEQLEQRLAAVEQALAVVQAKVDTLAGTPAPRSPWWERIPPLPDELRQTYDEAMEYGRYYRRTGKEPPPDWRPGDPIPEPEFDE